MMLMAPERACPHSAPFFAERLAELLEQIQRIESKIETLGSSTHPLAVEASALFPSA